jgi:hypothetical protein
MLSLSKEEKKIAVLSHDLKLETIIDLTEVSSYYIREADEIISLTQSPLGKNLVFTLKLGGKIRALYAELDT